MISERKEASQPYKLTGNLNVYVAFLRDCPRLDTNPERWGNFTDLEWLFEYVKKLGFDIVLLMPFTEAVDLGNEDYSPYTQLSPYIIDSRHIDWECVSYIGQTPQEKFVSFIQSAEYEYLQFKENVFIKEYAEFKRMKGLSDSQIDFLIFEQFVAKKQVIKALNYAHELGLSVMFDQPFFRATEGLDAEIHSQYFSRDRQGKIKWTIYQKPGETKPQQEWRTLAEYDFEVLRNDNYKFYIAPIVYFIKELGFDGVRLDAFHYGYSEEQGLYEVVKEALEETDALIIPENLGSFNSEEVDNKSISLGYMPYANPGFCLDSLKSLINLIKRHDKYFCVSSTHDTERIPDFYRNIFAPNTSDKVIAMFIHTIYAIFSHTFVILFGDEYISNHRINIPGTVHPWKSSAFWSNPHFDIKIHIQRLSFLRARNPFLAHPNLINEHITRHNYGSNDEHEVIAYTISSPERKKHIMIIVNVSDQIKTGQAFIGINNLGINIEKEFKFYDSVEDKIYRFKPLENVYEDGSVFYKLAPYQIHIWEHNIP